MALPGAASRWINAYARDPLSFVLHAGLVALLLWLSVSLRSRITDQMRCAWRVSLSKFDIHATTCRAARPARAHCRSVICLGLLLIALYPVPGWFGYPVPEAPEALQIFIDRITASLFPVLRHRYPDHDVARGFDHRLVQAEGRLQAGHHHHQTQDRAGIFCGPVSDTAALRSPATTFSMSATASAISASRTPRPSKLDICDAGRNGAVQPGGRRQHFPARARKRCRGVKTEFDTAQRLHVGQASRLSGAALSVRDQQEGRMVDFSARRRARAECR